MLFLCFGMFLIILSVLAFFRNRSVRRSEDATEAFWSREYESNHIRKKDISDLSYIEIPLDALPLLVCSSERCISLESQLTVLAGKKIVNLSNLSNTDLPTALRISRSSPSTIRILPSCPTCCTATEKNSKTTVFTGKPFRFSNTAFRSTVTRAACLCFSHPYTRKITQRTRSVP